MASSDLLGSKRPSIKPGEFSKKAFGAVAEALAAKLQLAGTNNPYRWNDWQRDPALSAPFIAQRPPTRPLFPYTFSLLVVGHGRPF